MKNNKTDFIQGNIACVEGAIVAGCKFFAGYPITPASEIAEHMSERMFQVNGTFIQTEDELSSIAAVVGSSWAGAKAMTATSGPGISLMQENIGLAIATETPLVIVDVQRGGPSTGSPSISLQGDTIQVKYGSQGEYQVISIAPSSPQEMFDYTIWAFNIAEKFRTPVFVMADVMVGHMREQVEYPEDYNELEIFDRKILDDPDSTEGRFLSTEVAPMPIFGNGFKANVTGSTHDEFGWRNVSDPKVMDNFIKKLTNKILNNKSEIIRTEKEYMEDAEVVLLSYGSVSRAALETVHTAREKEIKVGSYRLVTVWPFPEKEISKMSENVEKIIVLENNLGQIYPYVRSAVDGKAEVELLSPSVLGEFFEPNYILNKIKEAK
ncbi:2-oxoacid:acceptor oxidoreductase subunit alpha [Halanaerobium sp. MA284_MarDTE_T2]|uniref:2-oxoacid:acceptor oxidoreductase subunit alpha n=1 Tax=Halanaerobium sp. MA284_MarDTE_T2 TaxID=2183913 RepID=UPI000DF47C3E|nr:2-oxoacid:acceptor oxidoreductase subunit alpha [Halanaerobium sp. MA284_MarDTE_T2]RCW44388.1 2-oxoglutarate ferredoxin oxidoreductase alpha subunit [Halanaerobium sp. MA284_MarDTE_T2]